MPTHLFPNSATISKVRTSTTESGIVTVSEGPQSQLNWTDGVAYGTNVPGWRDKLRNGLPATTSMSGLRVTHRYTPGLGRFEVTKLSNPLTVYKLVLTGSHNITLGYPPDPSNISETKANAEAMGRFLRRAREIETAFQGGVFLGELGQTLSMIRNPAKGLRELVDDGLNTLRRVRKLGHSNRLSLTRVTKQLADSWLEVQFGWNPALRDLKEALSAFEDRHKTPVVGLKRITATYKQKTDDTRTTTSHADANVGKWQVTTITEGDCMVIYRGAMRVEAKDPVRAQREHWGFSLSNFAPTVWELIPYSFLIDYFTNIGDIIEGWSQLGTRLAWCNRTVRKTRVYTAESRSSSSYWNSVPLDSRQLVSMSFAPAKSVITTTRVSRAAFTQAMVPELVYRVPSFGSKKWLNIAALILSRDNDRKWFYD